MEQKVAIKWANGAISERPKCINISEDPQQPGNDEYNVLDMRTTNSGEVHNPRSETTTKGSTAPGIKTRLRGKSRNEDAAEIFERGQKP